MNPSRGPSLFLVIVLLVGQCNRVDAAKLAEVRTVDRQHLMIRWLDGEITYRDDGQGPKAFEGGESIVDRVIRYQPELDTSVAARAESYTIARMNAADPRSRYEALGCFSQDEGQWHEPGLAGGPVHS